MPKHRKMSKHEKSAKELATLGRYGDSMLVHMNPAEVRALNAMGPGLTINPETGMPEAFLQFLAPLFSALAPAAATALPAAATAATALPAAATAAALPAAATALPAAATALPAAATAAETAALLSPTLTAASAPTLAGGTLGAGLTAAEAAPLLTPGATAAAEPLLAGGALGGLPTTAITPSTITPGATVADAIGSGFAAPTTLESVMVPQSALTQASQPVTELVKAQAAETLAPNARIAQAFDALPQAPHPVREVTTTPIRLDPSQFVEPAPPPAQAIDPMMAAGPDPMAAIAPDPGMPVTPMQDLMPAQGPLTQGPPPAPAVPATGPSPGTVAAEAAKSKNPLEGTPFEGGLLSMLMEYGIPLGVGLSALMPPEEVGGADEEEEEKELEPIDPAIYETAFPGAGYVGGVDPEFDYFPGQYRFARGGVVDMDERRSDRINIRADRRRRDREDGQDQGGGTTRPVREVASSKSSGKGASPDDPTTTPPTTEPPLPGGVVAGPELDAALNIPMYTPPETLGYQGGGPSDAFTQGFADLMQARQQAMPLYQQRGPSSDASQGLAPVMQGFQEGGMISPMMAPQTPQMPMPPAMDAAAATPSTGLQQEEVLMEAVAALRGEHPNPEMAIRAFVSMFGPDALQALQMQLSEQDPARLIDGPGGPQDDMVPARINGTEEARLSDGEFVMTADAVRNIGGGDRMAGAQQLAMINDMYSRGAPRGFDVDQVR